ncbi:MAG: hypothetical protein Q4D02_05115, partial [Clostridia bacterium]|nr:hypothetical protein [Clostridia bacterium]
MKQGKEDKPKKISQNKTKRKRQTSIITVFLWLFLIATMVIITATGMKNKNALEVEDNNWNITLVMYDRSSDTPNQALTDVTWNATSKNETKQIAMQINYACTTGKAYQPGEIVIEIPGIAKDSFSEYWRSFKSTDSSSYEKWLAENVVVAADKDTDTVKQYDWSYSYNETTNTYTFTNNNVIAENEHFEGTIQIVYNLLPRFKIQTDLEFQAKIKENIENQKEIIAMNSNICNFHYTSIKYKYGLSNYATAGAKTDYTKIEDILDDYYWVRYTFSSSYYSTGVINAYDEDNNVIKNDHYYYKCIKEKLPEGCVLYDKNLNKIEPVEGNTYYYLYSSYSSYYSFFYYVGYPKSEYNEGDRITNTAELWGRYEDEEEMQKLAESSSTVQIVEFDFEYKGELYSILKEGHNVPPYINEIKNGRAVPYWSISATAFYTGSKMDVEIGDDLLYITRENGDVTKLEDSEYNFTKITIPTFYTYNKYSGSRGEALIGYEYDLQVRYKDEKEYVSYETGITSNSSKTITFDREDVVGIKLVIKTLDKTLYSTGNITAYTNIHTQDCKVGYIYNFDYLQVYKKDEEGNRTLVNEVTKDSYKTPSTLEIAEYDQETYGKYMQRDYDTISIKNGYFQLYAIKDYSNLVNNVKEEKYELNYSLSSKLYLICYNVDKDCIIKNYDILPEGMILASSEEEIKESITSNLPHQTLKLKDGTIFNTKEELEQYIKENTTVEIDYNYRNSGRIKVSIIYNLNGIDWSYYLIRYFNQGDRNISTDLKVEIPYESTMEYGTTYKNYMYSMWNNQEYTYNTVYSYTIDNGKYDNLANDIDNDGITDEKLAYDLNTLNIIHAVSSQQAVIKQVRTDLTKGAFVEGTAEATAGSEYTYKLRVTTGANSLKDLILYDTLETIYDENGNDISSGWKGEFVGVDTTYAESKGYAPVVYYSEEQNPGKLTEVPDKWRVLDESVDKTKVKSICVDLRYQADGSEM